MIGYSIGLVLIDHYLFEVSFINWLAGLAVRCLYLILFAVMKVAWTKSRVGFFLPLAAVLGGPGRRRCFGELIGVC
ncbi:hypothetical protein [Pseudomonas mucidolens]|uniref:Uncharacterized protein n=1 Tax=Pseudomonas mucidolens TaxID=46679 RepID=A0A1H2MHH6_9PSED|nr:hypothetical protein [Pseudomonas mucidolens]SDU92351.1 hypothetical protein SAMN05216202_1685 [Pseudomonas mucidolens]SQH33901.1 Uncharacterised protein [Pseudomonas mucidolens]